MLIHQLTTEQLQGILSDIKTLGYDNNDTLYEYGYTISDLTERIEDEINDRNKSDDGLLDYIRLTTYTI